MTVRIYHHFRGSKAKLCLHCQKYRAWQSRGLCRRCYDDMNIRHQYPLLRNVVSYSCQVGICCHCEQKRPLRPRNLCWACYDDRDIRPRYPILSKCASYDDGKPKLPILDKYPDTRAWPLCPCGKCHDGLCVECERTQRAGVVIVETEAESEDED